MYNDDLATPLLAAQGSKEDVRNDEEEGELRNRGDADENDGEYDSNEVRDHDDDGGPASWPVAACHTGAFLTRPLCPEPEDWSDFSRAKLRLLKFLAVTLLGIVATHRFVTWMNWEHRTGLALYDVWLYEGNLILLDLFVFFVVGRLHESTGVDHVAFVSVMLLSSLYTSVIPNLSFLQHSTTLYEIFCVWPWQLWVFAAVLVLPVCLGVAVLHVRFCLRQGCLLEKLSDFVIALLLFLLPPILQPSFEFHHYYAGWLIGMHCNLDTWWSKLSMGWCWGQYVNGIAVWGRDPILVCAFANYIGKRQHCFMDEGANVDESSSCSYWVNYNDGPPARPHNDWRNCSATSTDSMWSMAG